MWDLINVGHFLWHTCSKSSDPLPCSAINMILLANSNDWFTDLIKYHLYDIKIQLWQQNINQQTLVIRQKQNTVCSHNDNFKQLFHKHRVSKNNPSRNLNNQSNLFSFPPFDGFHWVDVNEAVCKRAWKSKGREHEIELQSLISFVYA